jgi:hypothetical protein
VRVVLDDLVGDDVDKVDVVPIDRRMDEPAELRAFRLLGFGGTGKECCAACALGDMIAALVVMAAISMAGSPSIVPGRKLPAVVGRELRSGRGPTRD